VSSFFAGHLFENVQLLHVILAYTNVQLLLFIKHSW